MIDKPKACILSTLVFLSNLPLMKYIFRQQFFIALITLTMCSCFNSNFNVKTTPSNEKLEKVFEQLTQKAVRDSIVVFSLDTLADFEWDTLVIIQPFFPLDSLNKLAHIDLSQIVNKPTLSDDGINILAFAKNSQIIDVV